VARRFYAEQGTKLGAQLKSDPNSGWSAILTKKTPQGELWYSYTHGDGNEESTGSYTLTTVQVAPLVLNVKVKADPTALEDAKSFKDPGWLVHQFSYFKLSECSVKDFDTVTLDLPDGQKPVAGRVMEDNRCVPIRCRCSSRCGSCSRMTRATRRRSAGTPTTRARGTTT
jgi:hypothetical protein